jgi:hypothetical protein
VTGSRSFYRRAIPIYLGTIVVPVGVLLWLGLQSFEWQRQALETLTVEKLEAAVERQTLAAAAQAFSDRAHPIAQYSFIIEQGVVVKPGASRAWASRGAP